MVWLHPLLLTGLLVIIVPVLLHLLMRAKPKKLVFPALRLIQNRKRTNVRRLRLRHLALLLLRMAVLACLVFAIARPSVPATDYSLRFGDWLRLALVAGAVSAAYFGCLTLWRRRKLAAHEVAYRRSYLRAGLLVFGLLALGLFVAWPYQRRIAAAITQPTLAPNEFLPVAAVMLFDTSLSMQYRNESRTRLEVAQEIATKHLGSLPGSSRAAIADSAADTPIRFQNDLAAAAKRITSLTALPLSAPLEDRLISAIEAQLEDQERTVGAEREKSDADLLREVYVFTDLAASAWRKDPSPQLKDVLTRATAVSVYLIDVGVPAPTNAAVTTLTLADQSVTRGEQTTLKATIEAVGMAAGEHVVELHVESGTGKLVKQGAQSVRVEPAAAATVVFPVQGTTGSVLQGEVRLLASDPLAFDDVRPFTLQMEPPIDVLVVAETNSDALFLVDALDSFGKLKYRTQVIPASRFAGTVLSKYAVVCLVNVADPGEAGWRALDEFVAEGGSALIVLGNKVNNAKYSFSPAAKDVLPGELKASLPFDPPESLDLQNVTHPLLRKFADWGTGGLTSVPISRYWRVTPSVQDTAVIANYTDNRRVPAPAFIERAHGKGRVLMLTTSLDRLWNDLPVAEWFIVLVDQMLQYLVRSLGEVFNYTIGETVSISLESAPGLNAYLLRKPGLQQLRNDIPAGTSRLTLRDVDQIGNYRLTGPDPQSNFERGFSVGPNPGESNLQRLTKEEVDGRLGVDRYSLSRDIENLQRNVRAGRLGREAFPLLALILLAAFLGEHFVANRFYEAEAGAPEKTST